jgi:hypothetical protein
MANFPFEATGSCPFISVIFNDVKKMKNQIANFFIGTRLSN